MKLILNVYTDDSLTTIKRVVEADKLKVPYRVAMYIAESLDKVNFNSEDEIFKFIMSNLDKVDKIIKATFGVSETELEAIDVAELGAVAVEVYKWGIEKINSLNGGNNSKNGVQTA